MAWKTHFRKKPDAIVDTRAFDSPNPRIEVIATYPLCGAGKYGILTFVSSDWKEVDCKSCLKLK